MPTTPFVDPWAAQPDQSVGEPVSEALLGALSDNGRTFARPPAVCARRTATQSIADSSFTAVEFTAADLWDTDTIHDASGAPSKFVVPAGLGGIWATTFQATLAAGAAGYTMIAEVWVNGSAAVRLSRIATVNNPSHTLGGATEILVSAGDEIEFYVWHNLTVAKDLSSARATARLVSWA